jgi:hypothetical protein
MFSPPGGVGEAQIIAVPKSNPLSSQTVDENTASNKNWDL